MANQEFKEFDEDAAIAYINNALANKGKSQYSEDDLILLMDAMYDFYEENEDFDEESSIDPLVKYIIKTISKDPENAIKAEDVEDIIIFEMEYESTLD